MVYKMKIKIHALEEGFNEVHFKTSLVDLGYDRDNERTFLFPDTIFVDVEINKISDRFDIKSSVNTMAHYVCDRCLEEFDRVIESEFRLYVVRKLEQGVHEEDDEYRVLDENEDFIDISEEIIESLLLEVPMKHICDEDCRGLCPSCGANLNSQQCTCASEKIDPRWEKLRELFVHDK